MKAPVPLQRATFGRLAVEVHRDRGALGRAAARACARFLGATIAAAGAARVIFAGGPSQVEFLTALADPAETGGRIDWTRVTAYQVGEWLGPRTAASPSVQDELRRLLLDRVPVGRFHGLAGDDPAPDAAAARYAAKLAGPPIDLVCLELGDHGRLAFNTPASAMFEDERLVKRVALDTAERRQQAHAGGLATPAGAPREALTITLPVFRRARRLSVHVPGPGRAAAVRAALQEAITTACPAAILRLHAAATLYLDPASAAGAFDAASRTKA